MADLAVTPAQVIPESDAVVEHGIGGEAIDPGEQVYLDATDNKWKLGVNSSEAAAEARGIAVSQCLADGQRVSVQTGGGLDLGAAAGAAQGVPYFVSGTAGKLAPLADVASGDYVTAVCIGKGANAVDVRPWRTGIALP